MNSFISVIILSLWIIIKILKGGENVNDAFAF